MAEDARTERTAVSDEPSARPGRRRERWARLGAWGERQRPVEVARGCALLTLWGEERPEESHAEPEKCSRKVYHGCFVSLMMYVDGLDR